MKIRLDENSVVSENFDVHSEKTMIAPMLFISLIENAFKHGVSNEEDNFIDISISESPDGKKVICSISNSYHNPWFNYSRMGYQYGIEIYMKGNTSNYSDLYYVSVRCAKGAWGMRLPSRTRMMQGIFPASICW